MSDTPRNAHASAHPTRRQDATVCLDLFWIDRYCGPNRKAANDPAVPQVPRPGQR